VVSLEVLMSCADATSMLCFLSLLLEIFTVFLIIGKGTVWYLAKLWLTDC